MALPNAKMKIKKDGITFESNVEAVEYTIRELSFACLYDVAKLLRKRTIDKIKLLRGLKKGKRARNAVQYWVRKWDCDLQIGYGNSKKMQTGDAWYAINQELGTPSAFGGKGGARGMTRKSQPRRMLLRNTVTENSADIEKISQQYFQRLNDEIPDIPFDGMKEAESGNE